MIYEFTINLGLPKLRFMIFTRTRTEVFLEAGREMRQGAKASHIGNFRYRIFPFVYKFRRTIQLVSLEEYAWVYARQSFHLVVKLRTGDVQQLRHANHVQL